MSAPGVGLAVLLVMMVDYAGRYRMSRRSHTLGLGLHALAFDTGLAVVLVAVDSPLDGLAAQRFSAHMVQHLLLAVVAAPLIAVGSPWRPLFWLLPARVRRVVAVGIATDVAQLAGRIVTSMPTVATLFAGDVWIWHIPALYNLTLRNDTVHDFEHLSLLGVGVLLFAAVGRPCPGSHHCLSSRLGSLGGTILATGALGVVLAAASRPFYAYGSLADQHVGGDIMVFLGSLPLLLAVELVLYRELVGSPKSDRLNAGGGPEHLPGSRSTRRRQKAPAP